MQIKVVRSVTSKERLNAPSYDSTFATRSSLQENESRGYSSNRTAVRDMELVS